MRKMFPLNALTVAAMLATGIGTAAFAQETPAPDGDAPLAMFEKFDANKDGKVTQEEVDAFKAARFAEADADKDGKLSAAELVAMRQKADAESALARAEKMVSRIDSDGDGLLTAEEFAAGPRPKSMIERLDTDGDGAVSLAEAEAAREKMDEHHGKEGHGKGHGPKGGRGHGEGGPFGWWFN